MTEIAARYAAHVDLYYHILRHLDLGRDAASLYPSERALRPARQPWAVSVTRAYRDAPGRLVAQILPLITRDLSELLGALTTDRPHGLRDSAGERLCTELANAVREQPPRPSRAPDTERIAEVADAVRARVQPVRAALWSRLRPAPPPLELFHCPSLQTGAHTHGRATTYRDARRVAVCMTADLDQVLCQIIHEEIHPVTDPAVRAAGGPSQDTAATSAGFAAHAAMEQLAIDTAAILIEQYSPELIPAYRRWRQRYE